MSKQECYDYLMKLHRKYKFSPFMRLAQSVQEERILIENALSFAKRYEKCMNK